MGILGVEEWTLVRFVTRLLVPGPRPPPSGQLSSAVPYPASMVRPTTARTTNRRQRSASDGSAIQYPQSTISSARMTGSSRARP